jgi:DNA-directed RNA polymerase specialized sigma24 family protein
MKGMEAELLRSFLQNLGREDRLVLLLHYADGLTPGEIGAVLGKAETRIALTLARLKQAAVGRVRRTTPGPPARAVSLS